VLGYECSIVFIPQLLCLSPQYRDPRVIIVQVHGKRGSDMHKSPNGPGKWKVDLTDLKEVGEREIPSSVASGT
jgi:hypothetical protein